MDLNYEIIDGSSWLKCEDDYVRDGYRQGKTVADIAKALKRSPRSVAWRARTRLKLRHARAGGKSGKTPDEHKWAFLNEAIRSLYADGGCPAVRKVHPGAPSVAICRQARELGVKRRVEKKAHRTREGLAGLVAEAQALSFGKLATKYGLTRSQVRAAIRDGREMMQAAAP